MKTIQEKAKAYDNAFEIAQKVHRYSSDLAEIKRMEELFPDLKESEDESENIRKDILAFIKNSGQHIDKHKWIAWLENQDIKSLSESLSKSHQGTFSPSDTIVHELQRKQAIKDSADNLKPKFTVGDWVVNPLGETWYIDSLDKKNYQVSNVIGRHSYFPISKQDKMHLWTIDDVKDGDILSYVTDDKDLWIMIYWSLYKPYEGHVHYHVLLVNDNFSYKGTCYIYINDLKPATNEQRNLLFQKMKKTGWKWNEERKQLEKISELENP